MKTQRRPKLAEVPLASVGPPRPGLVYVTLSPGQWDSDLHAAYEMGFALIEVDEQERPRRAYRTPLRN